MKSKLTKSQVLHFTKSVNAKTRYDYDRITAIVRYDDQCGNGHNTFSITGETTVKGREDMGGCIHEEIAKHFPELKHLIKWHLVSSDGPLHYVANATYHASDKDCHGLCKGERKQLVNGRTKEPVWDMVARDKDGNEAKFKTFFDSAEKPENEDINVSWEPHYIIGEGKEANLEAARSCAIWPDATLEQLRDVDALENRLPELMKQFHADVVDFGFEY